MATTKSPQSEPFLKTSEMQVGVSNEVKKTSVRKELAEWKDEVNKREAIRAKEKNNVKVETPTKSIKKQSKRKIHIWEMTRRLLGFYILLE